MAEQKIQALFFFSFFLVFACWHAFWRASAVRVEATPMPLPRKVYDQAYSTAGVSNNTAHFVLDTIGTDVLAILASLGMRTECLSSLRRPFHAILQSTELERGPCCSQRLACYS